MKYLKSLIVRMWGLLIPPGIDHGLIEIHDKDDLLFCCFLPGAMVDKERYLGLSTRVAVVFHLLILKSKQFLPGGRDSINPQMIQIPAFYTSFFLMFLSWHKNYVVAFPIAFFILKYFYQKIKQQKNKQKNIVSIHELHVYLPYFHNVGNNVSCPCMIGYKGRLNQDRQVGLK